MRPAHPVSASRRPGRACRAKRGRGSCRTERMPSSIRSKGACVEYATISNPLGDFPKIEWIRRGAPLQLDTVTAAFNANRNRIDSGDRDEGRSCLQGWFDGPHQQDVVEEVVGLGTYGKTLTVLTGMESPEWLEDEDAEIERSWEPRFR